jgi:hypothetical protein
MIAGGILDSGSRAWQENARETPGIQTGRRVAREPSGFPAMRIVSSWFLLPFADSANRQGVIRSWNCHFHFRESIYAA